MPYKDPKKQKAYLKKHYRDNKKKYLNSSQRSLNRRRQIVSDYKAERGCLFCGENEPICLDLHHKNPNKKIASIAWLVTNRSMETIKKEIQKCVVVCSNCHRKLHADILSLPS